MQSALIMSGNYFELMSHEFLSHQHLFLINAASFVIEHFNEDFCTSENVAKFFSICPYFYS